MGEDAAILIEIELHDFQEACSCVLTGAYTASEFAVLRVTENLAIRWYFSKTGKWLDVTFGLVIGALEDLYEGVEKKKKPKELQLLDYLNRRRIEVDHPKRVSTLNDAELTLNTVRTLASALKHELSPESRLGPDSNEQ